MQEEVQTQQRSSSDRPVFKLSVNLIDTYKHINKVYYEAKAKKLRDVKDSTRGGVHNDGYDDINYDYILQGEEILNDQYILKHKMGKGSFGQVVCAYDRVRKHEVAIKIIKSRKPFLIQARTEIEILNKVRDADVAEDGNIVRLMDQFMHRNHQCLVFEILSFNLYELLKNTKFRGVSLSLIRKFSKHLLKSLEFLSRPGVDIIHCDLKPENILLRHPRRSAIKLIDFGSSCYRTKRTYSYIQSRFYRSPEVLLGLPYDQKIDIWSLGCVVVEMHTGEPLFGGANQADQICRIVDILGMPPLEMIQASPERTRSQFFEFLPEGADPSKLPAQCDISCVVRVPPSSSSSTSTSSVVPPTAGTTGVEDGADTDAGAGAGTGAGASAPAPAPAPAAAAATLSGGSYVLKRPNKDMPPAKTLEDVLGVYSGGPGARRSGDADHAPHKYLEFIDFVKSLLAYSPSVRASAADIQQHPYILENAGAGSTATPTVATASKPVGDGSDGSGLVSTTAPGESSGLAAPNADEAAAAVTALGSTGATVLPAYDPQNSSTTSGATEATVAVDMAVNGTDTTNKCGNKDILGDRRSIGNVSTSKIRSHSAPGGISYKEDSKPTPPTTGGNQ